MTAKWLLSLVLQEEDYSSLFVELTPIRYSIWEREGKIETDNGIVSILIDNSGHCVSTSDYKSVYRKFKNTGEAIEFVTSMPAVMLDGDLTSIYGFKDL